MARSLGKLKARLDARTVRFKAYAASVPAAPAAVDWASPVSRWKSLGNNTLGNCTAVMAAHTRQAWLASELGQQWNPSKKKVVNFYSLCSGYVPGKPRTDAGADILTTLNKWRKQGLVGHKIQAYTAVDWTNAAEVQQAIWLFGSLSLGVLLPNAILSAFADPNILWDVPAGQTLTGEWKPNPNNGHAIPLLSYETMNGVLQYKFISWNAVYTMTDTFLKAYGEEAYSPLSTSDWCRSAIAPNGFDTATLLSDVATIGA